MTIGEQLQRARSEMSVSRLVMMLLVAATTVAAWLAAGALSDIKDQIKSLDAFNRAAIERFTRIDGRNDVQDSEIRNHEERLDDQRRQLEIAKADAAQAKSDAAQVKAWWQAMYPPILNPRRGRE